MWTLTSAVIPMTTFAPIADYELARIAQAQGRSDDARRYYQRMLDVYTHPPPGHAGMVADAREQLARLSGLREPPRSNR